MVTGLADFIDGANVRVIERCGGARFAEEPCASFGFEGQLAREHLQRDISSELRIARAIHLTHAASANEGNDFIRAEMRAGRERHVCEEGILRTRRSRSKSEGSDRGCRAPMLT